MTKTGGALPMFCLAFLSETHEGHGIREKKRFIPVIRIQNLIWVIKPYSYLAGDIWPTESRGW